MSTLNPFFAIIVFAIALVTAYLINLKFKINHTVSRYESVDGLRGFLAISVFISHSNLWYQFVKIGQWNATSNLYLLLGSGSVAFFFMISSFLFVSKLLNIKENRFDWKSFFISRIFRLVPMYYFSVIIIVVYVMIVTNWELKNGVFEFFHEIFHWATFTIVRSSDINDFDLTYLINAGVVWSLPYEWLFYFSLPIISIIVLKRIPPVFYLLISIGFIAGYFYANGVRIEHFLSFAGGIMAAFMVKFKLLQNKFSNLYSVMIVICLALMSQFENANNIYCKFLIIVIFILVATGNTLFGILKSSTLKLLGEISYSTYLLHGIILFTTFYFGIGIEKAKNFTPLEFSGIIFLIAPVVVMVSFLGYRYIEKPFMEISKKITVKKSN